MVSSAANVLSRAVSRASFNALGRTLKGLQHACTDVSSRPVSELSLIAQILKLQPSEEEHNKLFTQMINTQPQVEIKFDVARQVMGKISTRDARHYRQAINDIHTKMQTGGLVDALSDTHQTMSKHNTSKAEEMVDELFEETEKEGDQQLTVAQQPSIQRAKELIRSGAIKYTRENFQLLQALFQDELTKPEFKQAVSHSVADVLYESLNTGELKPLPVHKVDESTLYVISGHAGSGKGTLFQRAVEGGLIITENCCRMVHDDYHTVSAELAGICRPQDMPPNAFSGSMHDLVQHHIIGPVEAALQEQQKLRQLSPHILRETVDPSPRLTSPQQVRCFVTVHANIDQVIKGAQQREQQIGRSVDLDYIVEGQQRVVRALPKSLAEIRGKKVSIELHDTTYIHQKDSRSPQLPVLYSHGQGPTLVFMLNELIKMNDRKDLTYPASRAPNSDEKMVQSFLDDYDKVLPEMLFIDPNITAKQSQHSLSHCYAMIDPVAKQLVIRDVEVFNRVRRESPLTNHFFDQLDKRLSLSENLSHGLE